METVGTGAAALSPMVQVHGDLPGIEVLTSTLDEISPGGRFRPTDPYEEARSQAAPSGLVAHEYEDALGLEAPSPFGEAPSDQSVTAVDAGVVRLGNTEDGMVAVARAACITYHPDGRVELCTFRPGPIYVGHANRVNLFHAMGTALGKPTFYVRVDDAGHPTELKVKLSPHDHRILDRLRNFLERLVQQYAIEHFAGVLLIDGALTVRTYDTPGSFLHRLRDRADTRDVSLVAVAKKTGLSVRGVDIAMLLDQSARPMRRKITRAITKEMGKDRFLGDLFVARFGPGGDTYRIDVAPVGGLRSSDVLDRVASSCRFRNGYPEPLLMAHIFSYMTPPVVAELQAQAVGTYGLVVKPEVNLGPIFAPFGGRYK